MGNWTSDDWRNVITVIGLVVAPLLTAVLGYRFSRLGEERRFAEQRAIDQIRWDREQQVRFASQQFESYREFSRLSHALTYMIREECHGRPMEKVGGQTYDELMEGYSRAVEAVDLLAPEVVREASDRVHETAMWLVRQENQAVPLVEYDRYYDQLQELRGAFSTLARADLRPNPTLIDSPQTAGALGRWWRGGR